MGKKSIKSFSFLNENLESRYVERKGGFGVYAREKVQAGELLAVWGGRVVAWEEFQKLPEVVRSRSIQIEENIFLSVVLDSDPADHFNHSCDPNAGLISPITLVAMRDIRANEEVCFDYAMSDSIPYDEFDCQCGAPSCRMYVTGNDWQKPELQEKYRGYFSPYLQRRIDTLVPERVPARTTARLRKQ